MTRPDLESALKSLPVPLVGSLAFDHRHRFNLRQSCIDMMKDVMERAQPRRILEIGTHCGHSSCLLLAHSEASVVSVDIGETWVTWEHSMADWGHPSSAPGLKGVVSRLGELFPNRFTFIQGDSTHPNTIKAIGLHAPYELAFIDGNHDYDYVKRDIETAQSLKIPFILLDDCTTEDEATWRAAVASGLTLVKHYPSVHNTVNIGCGLFI